MENDAEKTLGASGGTRMTEDAYLRRRWDEMLAMIADAEEEIRRIKERIENLESQTELHRGAIEVHREEIVNLQTRMLTKR